MKVTAIKYSFLILLFFCCIAFSSAISFNFSSPSSVNLYENFSVSIFANASDIYDVKIVVQDASEKIISEIYNEGWKNPYYYLKSVFPSKSEFLIHAINYSDNAQICVKLRKSGSSSYSEACKIIKITESDTPPIPAVPSNSSNHSSSNSSQQAPDNEETQNKTSSVLLADNTEDFTPSGSYYNEKSETPNTSSSGGKIILTSNASSSNSQFITKDEKIRTGILYAFIALLIIVIIFLAMKKL
jgi:hypothetical protein